MQRRRLTRNYGNLCKFGSNDFDFKIDGDEVQLRICSGFLDSDQKIQGRVGLVDVVGSKIQHYISGTESDSYYVAQLIFTKTACSL